MVETNAGAQEIADDAGLSLPTVKKHIHLIFRKLEVTSRSQLIALMRSGIARDLSPAKGESRESCTWIKPRLASTWKLSVPQIGIAQSAI
jgi:hypothetical protein